MQVQNIISDTVVIPDFVSHIEGETTQSIFNSLSNLDFVERSNKALHYRGNEIARDKFFFTKRVTGDLTPAGEMPRLQHKYWYTGFQWKILNYVKFIESCPLVEKIANAINSFDFDNLMSGRHPNINIAKVAVAKLPVNRHPKS